MQETQPNTDPPKEQLLYDRLKQSKIKGLPEDFETFHKGMQNEEIRKEFHTRLSHNNYVQGLPEYDKFSSIFTDSQASSSPSQSESEPNRSRNPIVNLFETAWNTITKQVPSALAGFKAAVHSSPTHYRGQPVYIKRDGSGEVVGLTREELDAKDLQERVSAAKSSRDFQEDFQNSQEGAVSQLSQIEDPIDAINWFANSVGQGLGQIPASVATGGATSVGQEIGIIYMDQIDKIAKDKEITPEQVIEEGLDDQASAVTYGVIAGLFDALGAKGATSILSFDKVRSGLAKRGLNFLKSAAQEGGTEGAQSTIEQIGSLHGSGESFSKSVLGVDLNQVLEEAAAGAAGGSGVNAIINQVSNNDPVKQSEGQPSKQEIEPENEVEPQSGTIEPNVGFEFDSEATPEQQVKQLQEEQTRLLGERSNAQKSGLDTELYDVALGNLNKEIDQRTSQEGVNEVVENVNEEAVQKQRFTVSAPSEDSPGTQIIDNNTGKEIGRTSKNFNSAYADYLSSEQITSIPRIDSKNIETEDDFVDAVISSSENPIEIIEAFEILREQKGVISQSDAENELKQFAKYGENIPVRDIERVMGKDWLNDNKKLYFRTTTDYNNATGLDVQAEILSERLGREVTEEEIIESVLDELTSVNKFRETEDQIKERFKRVTGVSLTDKLIENVYIKQHEKQQSEYTEQENKSIERLAAELSEAEIEALEAEIAAKELDEEALQRLNELFSDPQSVENEAVKRGVENASNPISPDQNESSGNSPPIPPGETHQIDGIDVSPPSGPVTKSSDLFSDGFTDINDSVFDKFRVKLEDEFLDLRRYQEGAEKQGDKKLSDEQNPYQETELYKSRAEERINEFKEAYVSPILEKIHSMGWTLDQAEDFITARHAKERNIRIQQINPDNDQGSGMSTEDANNLLSEISSGENAQQAQELGALWDEMTKFQRDLLIETGLESEETVRNWERYYSHYANLEGDANEGNAPSTGKGFDMLFGRRKGATGRSTRAEHVFANTIGKIQADIVRAQKAEVGKALLRFVKEHPNPDLWTIDQVEFKQKIDPKSGLVERKPDPKYKLNDNVVNVKVNGVDHHITFHTDRGKRLAASLKNMNAGDSGIVIRRLQTLNRYLAIINTGANPEFIISNFFRDIQTAGVNLTSTEADQIKGRVLKDVFKARKGMVEYLKGNKDSVWARHAENFTKAGAKTGWIDAYKSSEKFQNDLQKQLNNLKRGKGHPMVLAKTTVDIIQRQNEAVENAVRLSAYVHSREMGMTDKQAASLAKNLTVNFNRKGQYGPLLNSLYLFYGASMNGSMRILKAAKNKKTRKLLYGTFVALTAQDIANRLLGGDDDEDGISTYDEIPQWVKERNIIIMAPFTEKGYFTIPAPYGYNVLNVAAMEAGKAISHHRINKIPNYSAEESALNIVGSVTGAFNPIGGGGSLNQVFAPTVSDPLLQIAENKDWAGRPVHPEANVYDISPSPNSSQFFTRTPETAKKIASEINELTGGTAERPGRVDIYPDDMQHMFRFITGGLGNFVDESSDYLIKKANNEDVEYYRIPVVGKLYGEVNNEYSTADKYRNYLKNIEYAEADLKLARSEQDKDFEQKVRAQQSAWLKHINTAKNIERGLQKLYTQRNKIEESNLSDSVKKERMERINNRVTELQGKLVKAVNETLVKEDE